MDGWIKWLGEIVWRATRWPAGVKGDEREENYWYRMYGVGSLTCSLAFGLWWMSKQPEPLSALIAIATTYAGADKLLAQGYVGVGLILVVGIPVVMVGIVSLATVITLVTGVGLMLLKGLPMIIGWWGKRYLERLPSANQAAMAGTIRGSILGLFIKFYLTNGTTVPQVTSATPE